MYDLLVNVLHAIRADQCTQCFQLNQICILLSAELISSVKSMRIQFSLCGTYRQTSSAHESLSVGRVANARQIDLVGQKLDVPLRHEFAAVIRCIFGARTRPRVSVLSDNK